MRIYKYIITKRFIFLFMLSFLFFIQGYRIFAEREPENNYLKEAEQHIKNSRYSSAVKSAADTLKQNPDKLDAVEIIMSKVRNVKNQYNDLYSELLKLLKKKELTENDINNAYRVIKKMQELDPEPDPAVTRSFDQARRSIVFKYNDQQFSRIMKEAAELTQKKEYWGAIALYLTIIGLHDELFTELYDENFISEMRRSAEGFSNKIDRYLSARGDFEKTASEASVKIETTDGTDPEKSFGDFFRLFEESAEIRRQAYYYADHLDKERREHQKEGEHDIPYLSVINRAILGRASEDHKEGIVYVMDLIRKEKSDPILASLQARMENQFAQGKNEYENKNYPSAAVYFDRSKTFAALGRRFLNLWERAVNLSENFALSPGCIENINKYAPQYLYYADIEKASADCIAAGKAVASADAAYSFHKNLSDKKAVEECVKTALKNKKAIEEKLGSWQERQKERNAASSFFSGMEKSVALASQTSNSLFEKRDHIEKKELDMILYDINLDAVPQENIFFGEIKNIETAKSYIDGVETKIKEGNTEFEIKEKYSEAGRNIMRTSLGNINSMEKKYRSVSDSIYNYDDYILTSSLISGRHGEILENIEKITQIKKEIASYLTKADEAMAQYAAYRDEGYKNLKDAEKLMKGKSFGAAREKLQSAQNKFTEALSFNADASFRKESGKKVKNLSDEILASQTSEVVKSVRNNLAKVRDLYFREEFAEAENTLIDSNNLWKTVYTEDNEEISYWLNIVRSALSVTSGRVIAHTDPLYTEMTQLLNIAKSEYEKALLMDKMQKREEAIKYMDKADEKLFTISIPFPVNQEANILALKILKLRDKENFAATFKNKYDLAIEQSKINPSESYIVLKDLQKLDPGYPGIEKTIYDLEIKLGMRSKAPDPKNIREAKNLYSKAYAIVRSNVRGNFPSALEYLNRAFQLDPGDQDIAALKDRVQMELGGSATVTLSSYAQEQFKIAQQEFINGNYYTSLAIVNNLLQEKRNRNYTPLLTLKTRIESRI